METVFRAILLLAPNVASRAGQYVTQSSIYVKFNENYVGIPEFVMGDFVRVIFHSEGKIHSFTATLF